VKGKSELPGFPDILLNLLSITHIIHKGLIGTTPLVNYSVWLVFLRYTNEMEELTFFSMNKREKYCKFYGNI